jgi:ABC-type nitrate/sulfonate/bicarbonate transport system permease component
MSPMPWHIEDTSFAFGQFNCPRCNAQLQSNLPPLVAGATITWVVLASALTTLLGPIGAMLGGVVGLLLGALVAMLRRVRSVASTGQ